MDAGPDPVVVLAVSGWVVASWSFPSARPVDLTSVDALARLALAAQRAGADVRLSGCPQRLVALVELTGLGDRLLDPAPGCSSVEVGGQAEGLEQPLVEEAVVADDPVA
jgi:hypothetical protein